MDLNYQLDFRKSITQMIGTALGMTYIGVLTKYLVDIPLMEIVFFRSIPTIIVFTFILKIKKYRLLGNNNHLLFLRCFFGFFAIIGFFYSVKNLVFADAMIIRQLTPLFVTMLSIFFLKEKVLKRQSIVFIISIIGALLVIKPGFRIIIIPAIISVLSALSSAASHVAVRYLRLSENSLVIVNYHAISSFFISLFFMIIKREFVIPSFSNFLILISIGFIGMFTQLFMTNAYRKTKASVISIYLYMQIFFGIIFSILFFNEYPDCIAILGGGLIFLGGFINYKLSY